jgi:dTDP-glucose 4,6-dehydratase
MKVCYVTGCLGFIATHLTQRLLNDGWKVIGVDKINYSSNLEKLEEFKQNPNFKFIKSDINDLEFLYDCSYIFHLAAESHVDISIEDSKIFLDSNVYGTHKLLELIKKKGVLDRPHFVYMSTDEVYGDILEGAFKETDIMKPSNPYAMSKSCGDLMTQTWGRTYGINYNIIRCTNNYGIYQYHEKLIPKTCRYLQLNKKLPLHNNGTPIRNWLHVDDTVNGILTIIEKGENKEIYNIAGNIELPNIEVVEKIIKEYYKTSDTNFNFGHVLNYVDFSYNRVGQDVRYHIDDSKLRSLGWSPKANFDEELTKIVEYYKNSKFIW